MELQEILAKCAQMLEEQRRVLEITDVWAARFFAQLDDIRRLVSQDDELRGRVRVDIQPGGETLSPNNLTWVRTLHIGHLVVDFIYVRQTRFSDVGVPAGKAPRLCARLLAIQHDATRTVRPAVSPRLVVNLFEDNWVAQIDPFRQPVLQKSGMTDDFEDLLPCLLDVVLFGHKLHPDLSWPAAESMRPTQPEGAAQEPVAEIKRLVEENLYGTARTDSPRLMNSAEILHLLSCLR